MQQIVRLINLLKRHIRLFGAAALMLIAVFLVSNYGLMEIKVMDGKTAAGEYTYRVQAAPDGKSAETKTANAAMKRLLKKSSYEITVSQGSSGFFAITNVDGFFRTRTVEAKLAPEKARTFVGDNPAPCMYFTDRLYSYECGGFYSSINAHLPATDTTPAYAESMGTGSIRGAVEGIIKTTEGNIILLQPAGSDNPLHMAVLLNNRLEPVKSVVLADLDGDKQYAIKAHKTGFIVYDSAFGQLEYYASLDSKPEKININRPGGLRPVALSISGDRLITVFSDTSPEDASGAVTGRDINSRITEQGAGASTDISFSGAVTAAAFCGENNLCVLSGRTLSVMDVSGGRVLYSIGGVNYIEPYGDDLLVARDTEIINLDASRRTGAIEYSFGEYRFCGMQKVDEGRYLLCVTSDSEKSTLLIDRGAADSDAIDKKLSRLRKLPFIDSASVSGRYIYISPNLGAPVYIESLGGFGYQAAVKNRVNGQIDQAVAEIGIARSKFQIINTLK